MSEPRYPYVHLVVPEHESELAADELWELGAQGIEERDASTLVPADRGTHTLVASFADEAAAGTAVAALGGRWSASVQFVVGDGWRDEYKKYFKTTRIGERLVIRPSWEPFRAAADDVVLTLDPGRAFGTGTHESTRLALALAQRFLQPGQPVLDVGCGSGILSIACLLLGASRARAVDIDPEAVLCALENARRSGVDARMTADATALDALDGDYPLVLANIESRVLVPHAAALAARVQQGGVLVLSGLLNDERAAVRAAYPGLSLVEAPELGEWLALALRKPAAGTEPA